MKMPAAQDEHRRTQPLERRAERLEHADVKPSQDERRP